MSPFLSLAVYIVRSDGWKALLFVWGFTVLVVSVVLVGMYLMSGKPS